MKIKEIGRYGEIIFDNGKELSVDHEPDCCECHWADTSVLPFYNVSSTTGKLINIFDDVEFSGTPDMIQPIEGAGFNLVATNGDKFFVPCYGENNGYYSTDLTLTCGAWVLVPIFGKEQYKSRFIADFTIDLTECQDISYPDY